MSTSLSAKEQISQLQRLISENPPSQGDRVVWNQSKARSGFVQKLLFQPLPSIRISNKNASASVAFRKQRYAEESPAAFITELQRLVTRPSGNKSELFAALRFWRVHHLRNVASKSIISPVPPLSAQELSYFEPRFSKSLNSAYARLFPRRSLGSVPPLRDPPPHPQASLGIPTDAGRKDCFSYSKIVQSSESRIRSRGRKKRIVRCPRFTPNH